LRIVQNWTPAFGLISLKEYRARKTHTCLFCGGSITPGMSYYGAGKDKIHISDKICKRANPDSRRRPMPNFGYRKPSREVAFKFTGHIQVDSTWAANLSDEELKEYIQQRLNSSLGFRGQIQNLKLKAI